MKKNIMHNENEDPLEKVRRELLRQQELWGEQNHPDGTDCRMDYHWARSAKEYNDEMVDQDTLTWRDILWEEVAESFAESDEEKLKKELIQVAAVAVQWVRAIERR